MENKSEKRLNADELSMLGQIASMDGEEVDANGNNIFQQIQSTPEEHAQYIDLLKKYYKSGLTTEALNPSGREAEGISLLDRQVVLNLSNSPQESVGYLQKKYPEKYFMADKNGEIFVNQTKPGGLMESGADWQPLDSTRFTAKDVVDVLPDVAVGAVQAIPWVAGKLNPLTLPAAMGVNAAVGGAEETARQALGALAGVNKSLDTGKVATSAAISGTLGPFMRALPRGEAEELVKNGVVKEFLEKKGYYSDQYTPGELADILQREAAGWMSKASGGLARLSEKAIDSFAELPKGSAREYFNRYARGTAKETIKEPTQVGLRSKYTDDLGKTLLETGEAMLTPVIKNVREVQQGYKTVSAQMKNANIPTKEIRDTLAALYKQRKADVSRYKNKATFADDLKELKKVKNKFNHKKMRYDELEELGNYYQKRIEAFGDNPDAADLPKLNAFITAKKQVSELLNTVTPGRPELNKSYIEALNRVGVTEDALKKNYTGRILTNPSSVMDLVSSRGDVTNDLVKKNIQEGIEAANKSAMDKTSMSKIVRSKMQDVRDLIIQNPKIKGVNFNTVSTSPRAAISKPLSDIAVKAVVPAARGAGKFLSYILPELENQSPVEKAMADITKSLLQGTGRERARDYINRQFPEATDQETWNMEQEAKIRELLKQQGS